MRKSEFVLSVFALMGGLTAVHAQSDGAGIEFSWTGNKVASVAVNPSDGGTISVSNDVAYDNQVVYLYHPKTKRVEVQPVIRKTSLVNRGRHC